MTRVVSISEFRQNISTYFDMVKQGDMVMVKDGKKDEALVQITRAKKWDPVAYKNALDKIASSPISAKDHPEWATRSKVEKWLRHTRAAWNRDLP